jgi:hypothetical protein
LNSGRPKILALISKIHNSECYFLSLMTINFHILYLLLLCLCHEKISKRILRQKWLSHTYIPHFNWWQDICGKIKEAQRN